MIDAQEPLKAAQVNIETAMSAIQILTDAKQSLMSYTSYQKALVLEKKSLKHTIEKLRDEKQQFELVVDKTKKELDDLKIKLTETQNEVLSQTYATKAASKPATGEAERNEDNEAMYDTLDESTNHSATSRSDLSLCSISPSRHLIFGNDMSFQCGEDEHDIDSWEEICTASAPSVLTKVPTSTRKRHCAKRVHWSPKKWRRMVRTHRLQSILIENLD